MKYFRKKSTPLHAKDANMEFIARSPEIVSYLLNRVIEAEAKREELTWELAKERGGCACGSDPELYSACPLRNRCR